MRIRTKALVVLSGGQDSATCMAWAANLFEEIIALSFFYGQRHVKELEAAAKIASLFNAPHKIIDCPILSSNPSSGLTNPVLDVRSIDKKTNLPRSFVPGRNLIFLTSAASFALSRGIRDVVTGVCETDYSGYPDCRRRTIDKIEEAVYLGNENLFAPIESFVIHTPLMRISKAETVRLAKSLPLGWEALALSWTCYEGGEKPCGTCPACELRIKGFAEAGEVDPAL